MTLKADEVERLNAERIEFLAATKDAPRRFRMVAYTGVEVGRFWGRFAIDLKGIEFNDKVAVLFEHNDRMPVGVADKLKLEAEGLVLEGFMLSENADADKIIRAASQGFPWKCSVGIETLVREEVAEGATVELNGRSMTGPLTIARRARLFETSFITCLPADPNTAAEVMRRQEGTMADLKDAPVSTEILRAEIAKQEREALGKRAEELRQAFPDRAEFANRCALEGKTLVEAKAAFADVLTKEIAEDKAKRDATQSEVDKLRKEARHPGIGFKPAETASAEPVEHLAPIDRATREWSQNPRLRAALPDVRTLGCSGVEAYAAWLRLEERLKADPQKFTQSEKSFRAAVEALGGVGAVERLTSWGKAGPDYADMTVKGFLGFLYRALEDVLGGSWGPRLGVEVKSDQETETYKFMGQFPQFREWVGNRQAIGMPIYSTTITNKLYEATIQVDINDFKFEKSGQLRIRMGEAGRRAGQHWEKLVTTLITANGTAYDSKAFFATDHTLGGDSGSMSNLLTVSDFAALNVGEPTSPSAEEFAKALVAVTSKFFTYLDDKGEPINGDARKFVVMVPTNLWAIALAAVRLNRLNSGSENLVKVQDVMFDVVANPRLDSNSQSKFYVFREDTAFKPFILQEASGVEAEFQGPGSDLAFNKHAYAYGIKATRAAGYGEWAHAICATLS